MKLSPSRSWATVVRMASRVVADRVGTGVGRGEWRRR